MGRKEKKDYGIYFVGNNAQDVTGSCTLVKYGNKQILLEMGLIQSNSYLENYRNNTAKFDFNPSEIDYCFILHGHLDHTGLLGRLVKEGFKGKIITNHKTASLLEPMLVNSSFILDSEARMLSKKFGRTYNPIYTSDDVYRMLEFVYEYDDFDTVYKLDDTVSFRWYRNSHCLGALQLQLFLEDEEANKKTSILYTSDIGALHSDNHYVENTEICKDFNKVTIMESTYGEKIRAKKTKRDRKKDVEHLKVAIQTVLEREGKLILPAFSFARTQELLTTIYELFHEDKDFDCRVVVDSMLSCQICDLYLDVLDKKDYDLWKKVYDWDKVEFIKLKDDSLACVKDSKPKIVISSSGFCQNGRVLSYLEEYIKDTNNVVVFSGYVGSDPSYLSYRLKNYKDFKTVKINRNAVENRADCITLSSFSSHASREDLIEFGTELNTEKIVLVHGSTEAKLSLQEDLVDSLRKNDKTTRVLVSNKDMVVHL